VAVLVGVLSIAAGFRGAMTAGSDDDAVIVVRSGATSELVSGLARPETNVVRETAGVLADDRGELASPELSLILSLPRRSTQTDANVPMRGVEEAAFRVHEHLEITRGRMFEWGRTEVIVGTGASREFVGLELGGQLEVAGQMWDVVGLFEAAGGLEESEIWADARLLQSVYRRGDSFQSVHARLESPATFDSFSDELEGDPRVNVTTARREDFYGGQSQVMTAIITGLGGIIGGLMGLGALFGALNTMYTSVSSRTREIATLRALGFGTGPILLAVLAEAVAIAIVGGSAGALVAWMAFDGFRAATLNFQTFSQVAFAFDVTPALLVQGVIYAALIGVVGGLFPAVRAARLPVSAALRDA
jgi:putative ABC transport system permease protein